MKNNPNWKSRWKSPQRVAALVIAIAVFAQLAYTVCAGEVVVAHDVNTLATADAGPQECAFAVNVAQFLTSGSATKKLLLYESSPGDSARDFSAVVVEALTNAGFAVTVTTSYTTPFTNFDAVFVAMQYPSGSFLDNAALTNYVNAGGGVYLAGGVGNPGQAATEAAGWSSFLGSYGLAFGSSGPFGGYNDLTKLTITNTTSPIFLGVTNLLCGAGSSIVALNTNASSQIIQYAPDDGAEVGVYAVVSSTGISIPQIQIIKAVVPSFSNLSIGSSYQLQISGDLNNWTNQGSPFEATNTSMAYPQYFDVGNWNQLFFRLQSVNTGE